MKVLIAGSSGLVGSALVKSLQAEGHTVVRLVRQLKGEQGEILWNPSAGTISVTELEGFDAIVNLAGDPIAEGRWNKEKKKRILESRVQTTSLLAKTVAKLNKKPQVFINASAIGFYGDHEDVWVDEKSPEGKGFLADVCQQWENSADEVLKASIRLVKFRIGVVLSTQGGALKQMLLPFRLGLGGVVGSGNQYMSWIHIDDLVRIIEQAISNQSYEGVLNAVAPHPVTNREFTKTLGGVLHRPTIFPLPAFAARLVFGEMADALLLSSCRVRPSRLGALHYTYKYSTLESALENLIQSNR